MRDNFKKIMDLQPSWTRINTPDMDERGKLIRHAGPAWLNTFAEEIANQIKIPLEDLILEGRDGTGPKTEVPWFRFSSKTCSPSATIGWYCVYLFDTAGEFVYLCLSHGSTDWENNNFVTRPLEELRALADWAQTSLEFNRNLRSDLLRSVNVRSRRSPLGPAYEASTALAIRYSYRDMPENDELKSDAIYMASLLGEIYRLEMEGPIPVGVPPEVKELDEAVAKAAGKKGRVGQGFQLNTAQRRAIELHAMDLAKLELESRGFTNIRNTSQGNPFDYLCADRGTEIYVEVKGTVSSGDVVILTRGEVEIHREKYPNNMLVLVHGIKLCGEGNNQTTGGSIKVLAPWLIPDESLTVIAYNHKVKPISS